MFRSYILIRNIDPHLLLQRNVHLKIPVDIKMSRYAFASKGQKITNIFYSSKTFFLFDWHENRINVLLKLPCSLEIVVSNFSDMLRLSLKSLHPFTLWHLLADTNLHLKHTKVQKTIMFEWYYLCFYWDPMHIFIQLYVMRNVWSESKPLFGLENLYTRSCFCNSYTSFL